MFSFSVESLDATYTGGGEVTGVFSSSSKEVVGILYAGSGDGVMTTCSSSPGAVDSARGTNEMKGISRTAAAAGVLETG